MISPWCACKIGDKHWEENVFAVDWDDLSVRAFMTEKDAAMFTEINDKEELDLEAPPTPDQAGKIVCKLTGARFEMGDRLLVDECKNVTGGDYDEVIMICPMDTKLVCVIGIEKSETERWKLWLANSGSICNYLDLCETACLPAASELVATRKNNTADIDSMTLSSCESLFQSIETAKATLQLMNQYSAKFSLSDTRLHLRSALVLFAELSTWTSLTTLVLRNCDIDATGAGYLSKGILPVASHLEHLDLSQNPLFDEGVIALSEALECLSLLKVLNLHNANIHEKGGRIVASSLARLTNIEQLYLSDNPIGDISLQTIGVALGFLPKISLLDLHGCEASSGVTLSSIAKGLVQNSNISVRGSLECLNIQDNHFDSTAVKRFLTLVSNLGSPQVIRLGRKRKKQLHMGLDRGEYGSTEQKVDVGCSSPVRQAPGVPPAKSGVEIIYGKETSPLRIVAGVTRVLQLYPGQVRVLSRENGTDTATEAAIRKDNMEMLCLEILCQQQESYCDKLVTLFENGNSTLHMLHIANIRRLGVDGPGRVTIDLDESKNVFQKKKLAQMDKARSPIVVAKSFSGMTSPEHDLVSLKSSLFGAIRAVAAYEEVDQNMEAISLHIRKAADALASLDSFCPSFSGDIEHYRLQLELSNRHDIDPELSPILLSAIRTICHCSCSDVLILRAFVAALMGDVERCVTAAEQGKDILGEQLSMSQVTRYENATLLASIVAKNIEMFYLVMDKFFEDNSSPSAMTRLATIIFQDLEARAVLHAGNTVRLQSTISAISDVANYAGLASELLRFSRLNSKWGARELRLQFVKTTRPHALTTPIAPEDYEQGEKIVYWQSIGSVKTQEAYSRASLRIAGLLQQAMGDAERDHDDPDGHTAAHEAIGLAFSNRAIGLVDELICQLVCQVTCNPSIRSLDVGWKLLVFCFRTLEPSKELCTIVYELLDTRIRAHPNQMAHWAQAGIHSYLSASQKEKKIRKVFAADQAVRLDVLRQILSEDSSFEIELHAPNGTGVKVKVTPFVSFEEVLERAHTCSKLGFFYRSGKYEGPIDESKIKQGTRWRDFAFIYNNESGDGDRMIPFDTDAYWWRWELGVMTALRQRRLAIRILIQTYVCAPSRWQFTTADDPLRAEMVYWQQNANVLRGDLCTSNPEALAFITALSSCIQIAGGVDQWKSLNSEDRTRLGMGHLPKVIRRRVGKKAHSPWVRRYTTSLCQFHSVICEHDEHISQTTLQLAFSAYLDMWPLGNGVVFREVVPVRAITGEGTAFFQHPMDKNNKSRVVVNMKGVFLLTLTRDSQTSRAVALTWSTPLDRITDLKVLKESSLHITTCENEALELVSDEARQLYDCIVAQSSTNFSCGNPVISAQLHLRDFAHKFRFVPFPPAPPSLYNTNGEPVVLGGAESGLNVSTAACVISNILI